MARAWRLLAVLVVVAAAVFVVQPQRTEAHAALTRADPPENAFLQRPPTEISLSFSEPLDNRLTSITLLDASGKPVAGTGKLKIGRNTISLPLAKLSPGIYNVIWSNVSSIDGHELRGSYPFTVLEADGSLPSQVNSVSGLGTERDPAPQADSVAVRALALLGLLLVAAVPLLVLVGGAALVPIHRQLNAAMLFGAAVLAVATVLNFATIRDTYRGLPLSDLVLNTRAGNYWLARAGAVLLVGVMATFVIEAPRRASGAVLVAVLAYLWSYSATSHAAAGAGSVWATGIDLVHGAAAVAWIGGVIGIALAARLRGRDLEYGNVMPRFGVLASVSVFFLLATGTLSAFIELDEWSEFTDTRYGLTLLIKIAAMFGLLALAAYNARWGRRRLESGATGEPRRFLYFATAEVLAGIAVFALAATLTQSTASKLVPEALQGGSFDQTTQMDSLNVRLQVDPNRTGLNTYAVTVTGADGQPVETQRVRLTFRYLDDQTVGPSNLVLAQAIGTPIYRGQGPYLTLEGQWRVEVEVRRADADDVVTFFNVRPAGAAVSSAFSGGAWDNPAPSLSWNEFGGLAALLAGLGLALFKKHLEHLGRKVSWGSTGTTAGLFGVGTLLLFGVHTHVPSGPLPTNPIFPDQNSISTGKRLFEANCASCHGQGGVPPKGLDLNPYPLDLTVHAPQHPDGQLFLFVHDGVPQSAMRAWGTGQGALSTEDIWHIVNFLRTLGPTDR